MSKELSVSVVIGATLKAGFSSVFGKAENAAKGLGEAIKSATRKQDQFAKAMRGMHAMNMAKDLSKQSREYARMSVEISKATKNQESLNKALARQKAASLHRQRLRSEMLETGAHAAVITAPIVSSIKKFMEQEQAAADLKVSMMGSDGKFGQFEAIDKLNTHLGALLPGNKTDFTRMTMGLKSQGISDKTILNGGGLATAELNVVLGNDISDGSFFAKLMEAHGIKESELLQSADLTQRAKFAAGLSKEDMFQAMSYYAPKANTLQLTGLANQKQILTVEGIAATKGLEGSSFGTNFAMMLSQLSKGSQMVEMAKRGMKSEVKNMIEKSGAKFEFFDKNGSLKSLRDITGELENNFNKIRAKYGDKGVMDVSDALFGQEGGRVAQILGQAGLSGFDAFQQKMDQQASLQDRIKVKTSTLASSLEQLGGVVENAAAEFGSVFAPDINKFAISAQNVIENVIAPFIREHKELIKVVFSTMVSFFGLKLAILGISYAGSMLLTPFRALIITFRKLKALQSIWKLSRLGKISKGASIFRMFGMSAAGATKTASKFGKVFKPVAGLFTSFFSRLGSGVGVFGKLRNGLVMLRQGFLLLGRVLLMTPIGWIITAITAVAFVIYKYWKPLKGFFIGLWSGLKKSMAPLRPLFNGITRIFGGMWKKIKPSVQPILNWFKKFFTLTQEGEGKARNFGEAVGVWIGQKIAAVAVWIKTKWQQIIQFFRSGINHVSQIIVKWSPIKFFRQVFTAVTNFFAVELPAKFRNFGNMIMTGLWNGLKEKWEAVKQWFSNTVPKQLTFGFTKPMQINSPSRLFKSFGGHIMEGLRLGLSDNATKPYGAISNIATNLQKNFTNKTGKLSDSLNGQMQTNANEFAQAKNHAESITINYNPTIQINGNADRSVIQEALAVSQREFEKMYRRMVQTKEFRSY